MKIDKQAYMVSGAVAAGCFVVGFLLCFGIAIVGGAGLGGYMIALAITSLIALIGGGVALTVMTDA